VAGVVVFIQALHSAQAVQGAAQTDLLVTPTTMALLIQVVVAVVMADLVCTLGVVMGVLVSLLFPTHQLIQTLLLLVAD
jgi:hypothetical protein